MMTEEPIIHIETAEEKEARRLVFNEKIANKVFEDSEANGFIIPFEWPEGWPGPRCMFIKDWGGIKKFEITRCSTGWNGYKKGPIDEDEAWDVITFVQAMLMDGITATTLALRPVEDEVHLREEIQQKVYKFFDEDEEKAELWMTSPNPMLGNVSPDDMIKAGRTKKLAKFVEDSDAGGLK